MQSHEIHHIKAYIVFFMISIFSIGGLIYLYFPLGIGKNIKSSVMEVSNTPSIELPKVTPGQISSEKSSTAIDTSGRRMRLTKILIRTQKEIQTLEDQRVTSPGGLAPLSEQEIVKLREKIVTIEAIISEIK